ncbi:hypothetical protein ACS0TY_012501 [Phlomoides rotata]
MQPVHTAPSIYEPLQLIRWDDDVIFKNQARGESKTPKRFINDTIRNVKCNRCILGHLDCYFGLYFGGIWTVFF